MSELTKKSLIETNEVNSKEKHIGSKICEFILRYDIESVSHGVKEYLILSRSISPVTYILSAIGFILVGIILLNFVSIGWIFITIGCTIFYRLYYNLFLYPRLAFKTNPGFQRVTLVEVYEGGIRYVSNFTDTFVWWDQFCEILEYDDYYYLLESVSYFHVIPKSKIENNEVRMMFRRLLHTKGLESIKLKQDDLY